MFDHPNPASAHSHTASSDSANPASSLIQPQLHRQRDSHNKNHSTTSESTSQAQSATLETANISPANPAVSLPSIHQPPSPLTKLGHTLNCRSTSAQLPQAPSQTQPIHQQPHQQQAFLGIHVVPQNQRVAQILQATGHSTTPSVFINRVNHTCSSQQQPYASSAPPSTVSINLPKVRPPVPLFGHSASKANKMDQYSAANSDQFFHLSMEKIKATEAPETDSEVVANSTLDNSMADKGNDVDGNIGSGSFEEFKHGEVYSMEHGSTTPYSSPGLPMFENNAGHINNTTVSPKDLHIGPSAPNSTALTNLTSPSVFNESPSLDKYEVSPAHEHVDFTDNTADWFPLFPPSDVQIPPPIRPGTNPPQKSSSLEQSSNSEDDRSPRCRKTGPRRQSAISGVVTRRRDKPLPPIIVDDPTDVVAMKRARNTLAARKSRQRKAERLDELESRIAALIKERDQWKTLALSAGVTMPNIPAGD